MGSSKALRGWVVPEAVTPTMHRLERFRDVENRIEEALLQAYRQTDYRVAADAPFTLRVGQTSRELLDLYARQNELRMKHLEEDVARLGYRMLPGYGADPSGDWPGEPSLLVLGISLDKAKRLGMKYDQNALVWCGANGVPELVLLGFGEAGGC